MNDYLSALLLGAGNVFSWPNILIPVMGTLIAMVSAFLPGIGGTSLAALLLLLTLNWEPVQVLLLFGALTGGATYMGSITAILFNIPGNASSAAAMIGPAITPATGMPVLEKPKSTTAAATTRVSASDHVSGTKCPALRMREGGHGIHPMTALSRYC